MKLDMVQKEKDLIILQGGWYQNVIKLQIS